jgi:hypothetical protein
LNPKTLKKLLKSALPAEFTQNFGSESADAVTTFTKDKDGVVRVQVYFHEGGNPLSMREEAVHISQLAEGGETAKKAALLTEENLAKWPKLSMEQRLDVYKAKVEVEVDAQQRLLKQFGEGDPRYVQQVRHNLENLKARMAEVDLGVKNPKAVEDADWLDAEQAPRLFSKNPGEGGNIVGSQKQQNIIKRLDEIGERSDAIIQETVKTGKIPNVAQNRINIRMGAAGLPKKYRGSGLNYALENHLNVSKSATKSQFSVSAQEITEILQDERVIKSSISVANTSSNKSGGLSLVREVDLSQFGYKTIGNLPIREPFNGAPTSKITIITDGFGNLKNVFPGLLDELSR